MAQEDQTGGHYSQKSTFEILDKRFIFVVDKTG